MSCPSCPVPAVWSQLSSPCSQLPTIVSWRSCHDCSLRLSCLAVPVFSRTVGLSAHLSLLLPSCDHPLLSVQSRMSCPDYLVPEPWSNCPNLTHCLAPAVLFWPTFSHEFFLKLTLLRFFKSTQKSVKQSSVPKLIVCENLTL
jgi:hypothetical protein